MIGSERWAERAAPRGPQQPTVEDLVRPVGSTRTVCFTDEQGLRDAATYDELAGRVARAAARLRARGVEAGSPVAISLRSSLRVMTAALAVWAAGGVLVSVPPRTRRSDLGHAQRFRAVLGTMGCLHQIVDGGHAPDIGPPIRVSVDELTAPGSEADPEQVVPGVALVQFTSGSLGEPKGVAVGRDALAGHLDMIGRCFRLDPADDTVATWLPMFHDLGLVCFFGAALSARVAQVHTDPRTFMRDPATWMRILAAERATITGAPNFGYRLAGQVPHPPDLDLSRVRCSLNAAERVLWSDLEAFDGAVGPLGFGMGAVMPAYGLAEGTVGVTCTPAGRGPTTGPGGHVSLGTPLPGNRVDVRGAGSSGSVHVDGDWLFDGYWTADGFASRAPGPFDTDDAGFLHDGELHVVGRRADVASIGGHNVFAEDVEAVVAGSLAQIVGCAAFKYSSELGERLALAVEIKRADAEQASSVARTTRALVSEVLGLRVAPVLVGRQGLIPRTTSGKPRRSRLRAAFLADAIPDSLVYAALR